MCCLSYILFIIRAVYPTCLSYFLFILHIVYNTYCLFYILSHMVFIQPIVYRTCCLSYTLLIVHAVYLTCLTYMLFILFCLSYVLFTLMWFITCGVCPTRCLSYVLFILHVYPASCLFYVFYLMLYIVTAGLDDWVTGMLKQYIFEVLSCQPYGIENLHAKSLYAVETWSALLWHSMLLLLICTVETSSGMLVIDRTMPSTSAPNMFECAVGGVRHPQHTQTGSN
jgi:hypothetical protein